MSVLGDVLEREAEREVGSFAAVLRVARLAERHKIGETIGRLPVAVERSERADMVNFECPFTLGCSARLTGEGITPSRIACLPWPVRAVVRLVATAPRWMASRVFTTPLVPARRSAETDTVFMGATTRYFKRCTALRAYLPNVPTLPAGVMISSRPVRAVRTELRTGFRGLWHTLRRSSDRLSQIAGLAFAVASTRLAVLVGVGIDRRPTARTSTPFARGPGGIRGSHRAHQRTETPLSCIARKHIEARVAGGTDEGNPFNSRWHTLMIAGTH